MPQFLVLLIYVPYVRLIAAHRLPIIQETQTSFSITLLPKVKSLIGLQNLHNLVIRLLAFTSIRVHTVITPNLNPSIPPLRQMDITLPITYHLPTTILPPPPREHITGMYEMEHSLHQKHRSRVRDIVEEFVLH